MAAWLHDLATYRHIHSYELLSWVIVLRLSKAQGSVDDVQYHDHWVLGQRA